MKKKLALIGAGNMGKNHARILDEMGILAAIVDPSPKSRDLALQYQVPHFANYQDITTDVKYDGIVIAVPTIFHFEIAKYFLEKEIPVLVEKPICSTVTEAKDLLAIAKKNKTALMVGHVERYNPAAIKLKELVDSEALGKIISINAMRLGIAPPAADNSCVSSDLIVHDVEFVLQLMGKKPDTYNQYQAKLFPHNCCDSVMITMHYPKTSVSLQSNWITPIKIRTLSVIGTKGFAQLDYIKQQLIVYEKVYEAQFIADYFQFVSKLSSEPKEVFVSKSEPLKNEHEAFQEMLHSKTPLYEGVESAIDALQIVNHPIN